MNSNRSPHAESPADRAHRRLFPLHLTPFESYMLFDDFAEYPMTFILQFEFEGNLDRTTFQTAIDQALIRHPMMRAMIGRAKSNRECWTLPATYDSQVRWGDWDDPIDTPEHIDYINLREEIGFRCWVRHNEERARCLTLFHHAAVDGIAAYQFIGDVLWFYASLKGEHLEPLPNFDPNDLKKRLRANLSDELLIPSSKAERKLALEKFNQPVQPLLSYQAANDVDSSYAFPGIHLFDFDKEQFRVMRLDAQNRGQNINDALLESLFVALAQWNQVFADPSAKGSICINMPIDLRKDDEPQYLAANFVSYALVRREPSQILNDPWFSDKLRNELVQLKHTRFNSPFMRFLLETAMEHDLETRLLVKGDCLATLVFSNTGDPTRRFWVKLPRAENGLQCGNLVLTDVSGSPPLRKNTRVSIGVLTYQRKLRICIRSDRRFFSEQQTRLFLSHFCELFVRRKSSELSNSLREFIRQTPEAKSTSEQGVANLIV